MFKVILLVCAVATPRGDCSEATAIHFMPGPECANEITCGMLSQAYLASTAIGQSMSKDEYLKIRFVRREPEKDAASL